ncbi:DUF2911 domain-containing protein [Algoriphagus aquimarinus]|uniref:DUF2911 domain-containing protein n=1 Tax=Algoriphagus aquimarinus TaxID=237018 RepID=UPI0030DCC6F7|tara:strand:- start:3940 stop:4539 length:600 start_codon:yes stop_codon:yes gene_type:complete
MKIKILVLALFAAAACNPKEKENHDMDHMEHEMESESHEMHEEKPAEAPKSPRNSVMAMTGGNHIHIDYSAPSARGRQIFGGLVAYDEVWVTGAHKATTIKFDQDVLIDGKELKSGKYGLFTIPGKDEWTVILNQDWDMHLADDYKDVNDIIRIKVKPETLNETAEALTFDVKEKDAKTTTIAMSWDKTKISFDVVNAN